MRGENKTMYRTEMDFLGEKLIPKDAYYGIHTLRAAQNFDVSRQKVHPDLIKSLAVVKQAAAESNMSLGLLDNNIGSAIFQAGGEIADGKFIEFFIVDAFQGGAGTSTNMNMNEVIANRAIEILGGEKGDYHIVHPLDHVNMSQSTNDVYPTALRMAAIRLLLPLSEACATLQGALQRKEEEFSGVLKLGRTEMQDAVPVTLGQEFSAWAEAISRDRWRLYKVEERLRKVNLGGTAVGTGINAPRKYSYTAIERLRSLSGLGLARDENSIDGTQNADVFVEVSGMLKACAATMIKISGDLRLLSSRPFGEIKLPNLQAGSSIMPGKVNPVMPEMITQVAYQVIASDLAITLAVQSGQLELNAFYPLIAVNLLSSLESMAKALRLFSDKCITGIEAVPEMCLQHVKNSTALATVLAPLIGYEKAAVLTKKALASGRQVMDILLEENVFTQKEIAELLQAQQLTRAGVIGQDIKWQRRDGHE